MAGNFDFGVISLVERAVLDGIVAGTASASKAVVLDANKKINELDITTLKVGGKTLVVPQSGTPVNAVAATGTLTISGVVIDGETVAIGDDTYEFCADTACTVAEGNIAVDINAKTVKSQGTLTVDTQPTAGDTMTIGTGAGEKEYTFVPDGTANADGEVSIGTNLGTAQANIVAAINGTDGISTPHTQVTALDFAANACVLTAKIGGASGDLIATTETFTAASNIFDAVTLGTTTAGVDCTAADAVTALVTAITASDTQGVGAADGNGDTVVLTADTKGDVANDIATTVTMAHGAFGAGTLKNGVDGTVASIVGQILYYDSSYVYFIVAPNTVSDINWRRITLGNTY
jgi:hypothetical protein